VAVIEVRDLVKEFASHERRRRSGVVRAIDNVSLATKEGEYLVLLGPSGCGKTTLLRTIAGLEQPTSGDVLIDGEVVTGLPPRARSIAMVFQSYALYPHKTVLGNIVFPLRAHGMAADERVKRARKAAELLSIEHLLDRKPRQLSGGERQRVALARALVREPQVFLLDEPLSNLDAKLRVQMRAELKKLHHRLGITTIYVTHDQVEAMTLGDRIAVLSAGRLQQIGAPQEVYDHPANVFVAGFIGSPPMNLVRGSVRDGQVSAGDLVFARSGVPDADVIVGIRPEGLRPVGPEDAGPGFELHVDVVEPLGDEVMVHGTVSAHDAGVQIEPEEATLLADAVEEDRAAVTVRLEPDVRPAPGSSVHLSVDPAGVHLFDGDSGLAIR
jgi:multiple sugar transport system ATP-binding protein